MKKIIFTVLLALLLSQNLFSQSGWYSLTSGTAIRLTGIFFSSVNTGYAVGDNGLIMKTANAGLNWVIQNTDTTSHTSVYFLNDNTGYVVGNAGVFRRTTNGGVNWTYTNLGYTYNFNYISFPSALTGYIVGNGGIVFKSTTSGTVWSPQISNTTQNLYAAYFKSSDTGYVSGYNVFLKTVNGGGTWTATIPGYTNSFNGIAVPIANNIFMAGSGGRIIKSTNNGTSWLTVTNPISSSINFNNLIFTSANTGYAVGDGGTIIKTTNAGNSWTIQISGTGNILYGISALSDYILYSAGFGGTIIKTVNGGQTYPSIIYKRYTNGLVYAAESMLGDSTFYAVSSNDAIYKLGITGNIIYTIPITGTVTSSCSIAYDSSIFVSTSNNYLYGYNKTGGALWTPFSLGAPATSTPTIDSVGKRIYLGAGNGNFYCINKTTGTSVWNFAMNSPVIGCAVISGSRKLVVASSPGKIFGFNLNLPSPSPPSWVINLNDSILVSPAIDTSGYFYFGSRSGKVYKISLTGTTNAGVVWQAPLASAITSSPTIDANGNIYIGTENGYFYSLNKNGAIRWFYPTAASIKSTSVISPYQRIYFGNDAGEIYGIDTNKILRFYYADSSKISGAMTYNKGRIYYGTEAGRLFSIYDSTYITNSRSPGIPIWGTFQNNPRRTGNQRDGNPYTRVQKISDIVPDKFGLYQNYPNPFNPATIIRFQIKDSRFVTLKVYNILGREVVTLVNEKFSPGVYSVDFDGTMFASGIYFYKLFIGDFTEIRKMILLK